MKQDRLKTTSTIATQPKTRASRKRVAPHSLRTTEIVSNLTELRLLEPGRQPDQRRRRNGYIIFSSLFEVLLIGMLLGSVLLVAPCLLLTSNEHFANDSAKHADPIFRLGKLTTDCLWVQLGFSRVVAVDLATLENRAICETTDRKIMSFQVCDDGKTYLVSREERDILIFRNNELLISEPVPEGISVGAVLSADGNTAVIVFGGSTVRCWNLEDSSPKSSEYEICNIAERIALDPRGDTLVVASRTGRLTSCEAKTGIPLPLSVEFEPLNGCPEFSKDGRWLAVATRDALTMLDMQSGEIAWRVKTPNETLPNVLATSSDGLLVAMAGCQSGIQIFNRTTGETISRFSTGYAINKMAFSSSGELLYVCGPNFSSIRVWSVPLGKELDPIELT